MFKYDYPLLPKAYLINLELSYKMDNFFPLYCYYTIWLNYKWQWNSPIITSAWWSISFQLEEIAEKLDSTINQVEIACKYYGMEFIRMRTIKRWSTCNISHDEDNLIQVKTLPDDVFNFYNNFKWHKQHKFDAHEVTSYIVNEQNKYLHHDLLCEWYDSVFGYRCFFKSPLTDLEKTTLQECKEL